MQASAASTEELDRLEADCRQLARNRGGEVYSLDAVDVQPHESVRLKCTVPLCEYYGVCKVCPPHIPGVAEFRAALERYTRAFLVVYREKIRDLDGYRRDYRAELVLHDLVSSMERLAFESGRCQAMGLVVGGCKLCERCTPPGEPCRHPYKARPSPEGFGVDVTELARLAGVPVEWPPRDYVTFMGMVLV